MGFGKNVDKRELTSIMINLLVRLSYKLIYLFLFDDLLLNQMNALNPNTFNFNDYCAIGQRFRDTVLKEDYEIFYQHLEKFELKLNEYKMTFYQSSCIQKDYSLLSKLALSIISLPYSNAEVERMFSQLKLCKNFQRNALKNESIEALLICKNASELIDIKNPVIVQNIINKQIEINIMKAAALKQNTDQRERLM